MKKKISLTKRTIQQLKLRLNPKSDRKVAPMLASDELLDDEFKPSNGQNGAGCTNGSC
jgi:hypothetical protein